MIGYSLSYGSNQVRLVSGPSPLAMYVPTLMGAITQAVYNTDPLPNRLEQLRDNAQPQGGNDPAAGLWANGGITFGHNSSTASLATASGAVTISTGFVQQSYDMAIGGDLAFSGALTDTDTDTLIVGGLVGMVGTDVSFNSLYATGHVSGVQLGGYASWMDEGWFVNADVIGDLMTLGYNYNGASLLTAHPDVNALSLNIQAGNQFMLDDTFYVEPIAALAYGNVQGDDAISGAGTVHFGSSDSLRLGFGGRIGTDIQTANAMIDLSLTARGWSETSNSLTSSYTLGGTTLPFSTRSVGSYGEIAAGMKVMGTDNGLTGFLNGALQVNGIFNQFTISGGLRYAL